MAKEIQIFTTREDFAALVAGLAKDIAKDLHPDEWVSEKEAMRMLQCGKTRIYNLRTGKQVDVRFVGERTILYNRKSVLKFIENSPKIRFTEK